MLAVAALAILHLAPTSVEVPYRAPQLAVSENFVALAYGSGREIYVATSVNDGKEFSQPVKIAEVPILPLSRHRGPRIVISEGALIVTAVTGNTLASGPHAHGLPSDGDLFAWRSTDRGKTWSKPLRVNDVPGAARDLYLLRSADATQASHSFGKPQKLGNGTWMINACPMDGGGLAHTEGRTITAWRREQHIFLAEPGKSETPIGEGKDVAVAASQGRVYALFLQGTQLVAWVEGKTEVLTGKAALPALAALPGGGVIAAWEENGGISVRRLP